ncbi:MAG: molybdopterin-dependent oxidoreductase, partial [Dehalococcoidia bacterium]|nr:molybdopterin-dependent oxidoreductase [Dehalococcoidia bacterium]
CPLMVRVVNGKAVQIRGNKNSTWTRGELCPKGRLNLQILYEVDRVKAPLKRTNPNKGRDQDPRWVEITWDEALNTIAAKMADLLYGRLPKAFGTPNTISHSALCSEASKAGSWYGRGKLAYSSFDLEDSNYVIAFGAPILESNRPFSAIISAFARGRRGRPNARLKLVVVDPRYSVTASRADEWIPINPGTDGALALGMAHVILTEGLWSKKFVGNFKDSAAKFVKGKDAEEASWDDAGSTGLIKWWNLFLKDFSPAEAAEKTGIPTETIVRLAREFAGTQPAITIQGRGSTAWPGNGTYNSYAVYVLNGLVGSVDVKGGLNHYSSVNFDAELIPIATDDLATNSGKKARIDEKGTVRFPNADVITNNCADNILKDFPYPIEMALAFWNNFTFSAPGSRRWEEALKKIPFVVHHTTHISEWSIYSDIVLPAQTYLEKWGCGSPAGGANLYSGATLYQPVVDPLFDTRSEADLALALGKKLGERYPSIKKSFDGIGGAYGDTTEGYVKARTEALWKTLPGGWNEFRQKGTVNVGPYKFNGGYDTPSKKFEFYSGNLKKLFEDKKVTDNDLASYHIKARGDVVYVPHHEDPTFIGDSSKFPLVLISYKNVLSQEGRSANTPWTQEMYLAPLYGAGWTNFAEINPSTAANYGIQEGDAIVVESEVGKITAKAKLSPGIHPVVVAMCYGQGHWAYGRWAKDKGSNPNEITGVMYEHITGMAAYFNTRVKVQKA